MKRWAWILAACVLLGGCNLGGGDARRVVSDDGVAMLVGGRGDVLFLQLDDHAVAADDDAAPGGFYVRRPGAAWSGRKRLRGKLDWSESGRLVADVTGGGVGVSATFAPTAGHTVIEANVRRLGRDRGDAAVTVGFALPLDATGWSIARGLNQTEQIAGDGLWANLTSADTDWDGRLVNRGLFTPLLNDRGDGLAVGVEPGRPQVFRVLYRRGLGLAIEFDLALTDKAERFAASAPLRFVIFRFDGAWGMRSALRRYYEMFPARYRTRPLRAWENTARIPAAADFPPDLESLRSGKMEPSSSRMLIAAAPHNSYVADASGGPADWTAWPGGKRIAPLNPDPDIPGPNQADVVETGRVNRAQLLLTGLDDLHGRYVDNYRPEHLRVVDFPLTFGREGRPVQPGLTRIAELLGPLAKRMAEAHQPLLAEVRPWRAGPLFEAAWLDAAVLSGSTPRNPGDLADLRALMGPKPILIAGPLDYARTADALTLAQLRIDAHYLLAMGIEPNLVALDQTGRPMNPDVVRLVSIARRLADARWQPVPHAVSSHPQVTVERFGRADARDILLVAHNRADERLSYRLTLDLRPLGLSPASTSLTNLVAGKPWQAAAAEAGMIEIPVQLDAGRTEAFLLTRGGEPAMELVKELPEASPPLPPEAPVSVDLSRYDGPAAGVRQRALGLGPASWLKYLACYEAEKRFVARDAGMLFAAAVEADPALAADRETLERLIRKVVDYAAAVWRPEYASALNGPQYVQLLRSRESDWRYSYRFRVERMAGRLRLRLSCWDPAMETGRKVRAVWE